MATYKTQGIIIARKNFFEADRIITVLSLRHGKIKLIAKGVRKFLSKNAGSIELFVISNLLAAEGRNFDVLASAEIVKSFKDIRGSLEKTALAYKMAELVDRTLEENQEHDDVFDLLKASLEYLDNATFDKNNLIFEFFAINLLSKIGFAPELNLCVECQKKLEAEENYFDPGMGGILCQDCSRSAKIILRVNPNQIKLLRIFLTKEIEILRKVKINPEDVLSLKKIIKNFIEYVLERELKSERFAQKIKSI